MIIFWTDWGRGPYVRICWVMWGGFQASSVIWGGFQASCVMCEGFQAYWYCAWAVGAPPESVHTPSERRVPRWVGSGSERPLLVCGELGVSPRGWCCVLVSWEWARGADTILRFTYWARGASFWFILTVEIICLYCFKRRIIWYSLFYCTTDLLLGIALYCAVMRFHVFSRYLFLLLTGSEYSHYSLHHVCRYRQSWVRSWALILSRPGGD